MLLIHTKADIPRVSQLEEEMDVCFEFLNHVYGTFGFEFNLKLSTRPDKFLGKIETWDEAERVSRFALITCQCRGLTLAAPLADALRLARQVRSRQVER